MHKILFIILLSFFCANAFADDPLTIIDNQITAHPQQSGVYVLDKGEEALVARAWLADLRKKP